MISFLYQYIKKRITIMLIFFKWIYFMCWFGYNYNNIKTNPIYAKLLKTKLENLGILGIKLGQYLCNRIDVCTYIMKEELKIFLNNNSIHSFSHTKNILDKAGIKDIVIGEVIGSGSLTQVYMCKLDNIQEHLVLKVKHPEVFQINNEIIALKSLIRMLSYFKKFSLFVNLDWNEFFMLLEKQLDLNNEKVFLEKYYNIYENKIPEITTPKYIMGNEDYIIMTWCPGKPLNCIPKSSSVYKKAHNLFMTSSLHTFFIHQITHGDVHEGNILVKDDGTISIIDFGICLEFSEEQYQGIFAISKFENNPTLDRCKLFISALIQPCDVYNKPINLEVFSKEVYDEYITLNYKFKPINMSDLFNLLSKYIQKYNVLLKGNILSYILNMILLEGLSPYDEKIDISTYVAANYMKNKPFFIEEMDFVLDEYYNELIKKIPVDIIEKYKNIELLL